MSTGTLGTWTIPSRTGGSPHHVTLRDARLTCDCAAGAHGVRCWAVNAVSRAGLPIAASDYAYRPVTPVAATVPCIAERATRASAFAARMARQ